MQYILEVRVKNRIFGIDPELIDRKTLRFLPLVCTQPVFFFWVFLRKEVVMVNDLGYEQKLTKDFLMTLAIKIIRIKHL